MKQKLMQFMLDRARRQVEETILDRRRSYSTPKPIRNLLICLMPRACRLRSSARA
jgi:uncharacterized protein (DUF1778 family)